MGRGLSRYIPPVSPCSTGHRTPLTRLIPQSYEVIITLRHLRLSCTRRIAGPRARAAFRHLAGANQRTGCVERAHADRGDAHRAERPSGHRHVRDSVPQDHGGNALFTAGVGHTGHAIKSSTHRLGDVPDVPDYAAGGYRNLSPGLGTGGERTGDLAERLRRRFTAPESLPAEVRTRKRRTALPGCLAHSRTGTSVRPRPHGAGAVLHTLGIENRFSDRRRALSSVSCD